MIKQSQKMAVPLLAILALGACQPAIHSEVLRGATAVAKAELKPTSTVVFDKSQNIAQIVGQRENGAEIVFPSAKDQVKNPDEASKIGDTLNCSDFDSQEEALEYLLLNDPHRIDRDKDGIPCEHLPLKTPEN